MSFKGGTSSRPRGEMRRHMSVDEGAMLNSSRRLEVKFYQRMPSSEEFDISVAILRRAKAHRLFLNEVDAVPQLQEPHVIHNAIRRYETYWLPLVSKYEGGKDLEPPIDVHWIWHAHMLGPKYYHGDCLMLCGTVPDHKLHAAATVQQARFEAKMLWESMFQDEPFDADFDHVKHDLQYRPMSSYKLQEAVNRQKAFYYNVSLPHYLDERFVKTAVGRYKQFMRLKKIHPGEYIVPMYDVDWIWHTHMLSPLSYKKDTESYLGRMLHHDDTTVDRSLGSKLSTADARTKELWYESYHTHFSSPGCMYRGVNPVGKLHPFDLQDYDKVMSKKCGFRISKIVVKCDKKKDTNFEAHFDIISGGVAYLTQDQSLGKSKQPEHGTYEWEPEVPTPKGIYQFDMDTLSTYILRLEITTRGALKGLLPGKDHQEFRIELSEAIHKLAKMNSDDNGHLKKIVLDTRQEPCCNLYVHCALSQLKRMDEDFKLVQDGFETVTMPEHIEQLWGPVPLPALPAGVPNTCRVATHRLVSEQNYKSLTCRVVHSLPLRMSVVQVFQGPQMVAISHLIGTEQLPTDVSDRVGNPNSSVILETKLGERALLIKNAHGDWGIVKGHWTGFRKERLGKGSRRAKPGHLKIRFYNLKSDKIHAQSATLYDRNGADTSFKLGGIEVDVKQGCIKIRGDTEDVAENLALAFSTLMLFMLCEPRDKVTVHSLRKGYGEGKPFTDQVGSHDYLYQTNPRRIMFFLIVGYNEETPSNSHLYLASREDNDTSAAASAGPVVPAGGDIEEDFLAGDVAEDVGEDAFCPWEHGDSSGGAGGDLGSSSYDASFNASTAVYSSSYNGSGEASCGASCGSCGAGCGASCGGE